MHRFVLYNDGIVDASETCVSPGHVGFMTGWGVFSTVRVSHGVLFEFGRHFARMARDASIVRVPFPRDPRWLEERLLSLVEANNASEATLRVNVIRNKGGLFQGPGIDRDFDVVAFSAELTAWGDSVRLGVVRDARHAANQFAGTKVTSWIFNLNMYEEAHEQGFDEVVLLNERGEVSECTSANIFAVSGGEVRTPPLLSGCLAGVTREVLLNQIKVKGISIVERALTLDDLTSADEVFITSTTRDLLPVAEIAGSRLNRRGEVCARLRAAFRAHIEDYCCSRTLTR
jgi:branched-chain amino acid aminotransferase